MTEDGIKPITPNGGALSAEHYQTFEMAKENDDILGGDSIAQIRSYAAYARAQAQAIHKTIAATSGIDDVAAIKAEALETEQTFAKVGIYADQRIGELLRELPASKGGRPKNSSDTQEELTKASALQDAGISRSQAYDLQAMASNPEVVQAVLDKAEAEGRIPSRKQVLDAIKDRDAAKAEVTTAKQAGNTLKSQLQKANDEIAALEQQNNDLYDLLQHQQVVEREVVREVIPDDYEDAKRRVRELQNGNRMYSDENQKLRRQLEDTRKELDKAKGILGVSENIHNVRRDVQYLITATNQYVRQYGGLTWTVQQLETVDDSTREELRKAVRNLATFSSALMTSLEDMKR